MIAKRCKLRYCGVGRWVLRILLLDRLGIDVSNSLSVTSVACRILSRILEYARQKSLKSNPASVLCRV